MSLFLRTSGADDNPSGASTFCSIPRPVGVRDGDLVLVSLAIPAAGVIITPPSEDWTEIARTDASQTLGVVAYYRTALNEPARWVFALSASCAVVGGAVVYGNTDPWRPVDATSIMLTNTTGGVQTHGVASLTASQHEEELVLILGAKASGGYSPTTGFMNVAAKDQSGAASWAVQRKALSSAQVISAFSATFNTADILGATLLVALTPSVGTLSVDDVRGRIVGALPGGVEKVYDLEPGGDYYKYFQAIASIARVVVFDLRDLVRFEIVPYLSRYKLPEWENLFGLETTRTARLGTIPQRQAQLLSAFRAAAGQGSSIPDVQAVLAPLLGYHPSTPVEIIECDRSALTLAHSYGFQDDVTLPSNATTSVTFDVRNDGGKVSNAGARLCLVFASANLPDYVIRLTAPNGAFREWAQGWDSSPVLLYAEEFAGVPIRGTWTLAVTNGPLEDSSTQKLLSGSTLFVEGIASNQDTGGAIFHWGVYADPAHLGENGTAGDIDAVHDAIQKMRQSHTSGVVLLSKSPRPDVASGVYAAIPDRCIPV